MCGEALDVTSKELQKFAERNNVMNWVRKDRFISLHFKGRNYRDLLSHHSFCTVLIISRLLQHIVLKSQKQLDGLMLHIQTAQTKSECMSRKFLSCHNYFFPFSLHINLTSIFLSLFSQIISRTFDRSKKSNRFQKIQRD